MENYFENTGHMSVSKFKRYDRCEYDGFTDNDYPMSIPMLVGSYVDSYVEGTLDKFKEENPEIFSTRGATKGQLKSDYKQADEIIEFINNDKMIQKFLNGERQVMLTGEICNIPFKGKLDVLIPHKAIVDMKIMRTITDRDGKYYDFISKWGYDIQMATYQELVYQNTGERLPCYILVVTKETPFDSAIIQIPQSILDMAMGYLEMRVEKYYKIYKGELEPERCGHCDTCRVGRTETPLISMRQIMGESYE